MHKSQIIVVVSVDWEGRSLLPENLQLIATFRRLHPDVPMQHFLNAAYYTRTGIDPCKTTEAIQQVLLPSDDHGLHVHAWASLLSAARVRVREAPLFSEGVPSQARLPDDWEYYPPEPGYDVPLECFEITELEKIIQASVQILTAQGFQRPASFRSGGWIAGKHVHEALVRNGFILDCSAVEVQPVSRRFGDIALSRWLCELWPSIDGVSQPFRITTPSGEIWEFPNNGNLVDYLSADEIIEIFLRNVTHWQEQPEIHRFISLGFHQETARKFLDRVHESVSRMKRLGEEMRLPLLFTATPQKYLVSRL